MNFNKDIRNSDWNVVLDIMETQKAYTKFHSIIQSCFERNFPERQYRSSYRTKLPWITDELGKKISLKNKLFYIYKKRPTQVNQEKYKKYKREINKLIRKARREYYNKKIGSNRTNLKIQWKYIKEIMGNTTKNDYPESFDYGCNTLTHPSDICNGFNEFFVNIGLNLANKIPASGNVFEQYLNQPNPKSIFLNPTTEMETLRIFSDLRVSAPGWDNISLTLIKPIVNYILPQLVHIFNLSFQQGVVPSETKIARVKPLYKSDNPNLFCNYRPISILPIFSKVFEKLIHKRLITFFTENDIIYDYQFGFRERHSTSLALTFLNHRIASSFENNQISLGIFLDFSKAFDTVNFQILFKKLEHYGIRGTALIWIVSYLTNRQQYVHVLQSKSEQLQVTTGVPQGSILGPLLFLIYINDLSQISNKFYPLLYADDCSLFLCGTTPNELISRANLEMKNIFPWLCANKLSLNINKSKYMLFYKRILKFRPTIDLLINNQPIDHVLEFKFLGFLIDENLTWSKHTAYISNKMAKNVGMLFKLRKTLNTNTLRNLYFALIHSYLNNGITVWGSAANNHLASVFKLQKRAIRAITFSGYRDHTAPLFKSLNILPLDKLYLYNIALFMYKRHHNLIPGIIESIFLTRQETLATVTRQRNHLHVPFASSRVLSNSLSVKGPLLYNSLSQVISINCSIHKYKKSIKSYYLSDL